MHALYKGAPRDHPACREHPASILGGAWLADAGRGMLQLLNAGEGRLQVHMSCMDIYSTAAAVAHPARKTQDGEAGTLALPPQSFQRIYISHVCDYTTLLPAFTLLLPSLAQPPPESKVRNHEKN